MTKKFFLNSVTNGKEDIIQKFLDLLEDLSVDYCIIGGLAVNAYVEPLVSLDLDVVVALSGKERLLKAVGGLFSAESFEHSINLKTDKSDLRIQIQTDSRYQDFLKRASKKLVMGYQMNVASLEDVLTGKSWAYLDDTRRKSKRQKDLADIFRIVESYPHLKVQLPDSIRELL